MKQNDRDKRQGLRKGIDILLLLLFLSRECTVKRFDKNNRIKKEPSLQLVKVDMDSFLLMLIDC